jgi:hypothetical protein
MARSQSTRDAKAHQRARMGLFLRAVGIPTPAVAMYGTRMRTSGRLTLGGKLGKSVLELPLDPQLELPHALA